MCDSVMMITSCRDPLISILRFYQLFENFVQCILVLFTPLPNSSQNQTAFPSLFTQLCVLKNPSTSICAAHKYFWVCGHLLDHSQPKSSQLVKFQAMRKYNSSFHLGTRHSSVFIWTSIAKFQDVFLLQLLKHHNYFSISKEQLEYHVLNYSNT